MDTKERREQILSLLAESAIPVSASKLAARFDVSRQIIVGDIGVLRAAGHEIEATARGYLLGAEKKAFPFTAVIACRHGCDRLEEELNTIVDFGGTVIDVSVDHGIYGQLTGRLGISSRYEVKLFMEKVSDADRPLSVLSGGLHFHKIGCPDEEIFNLICAALREKVILVEE